MLSESTNNSKINPENSHIARYRSIVVDAIHSQDFLFGKIDMGKFRRKIPLCACGCKERVKWNKRYKRFNKFIIGHHVRINNPSKRPEIAKKISKSLTGRKCLHMVGKNNFQYGKVGKLSPVFGKDKYAKEKTKPAPLCKCGCNQKTKWCLARKKFNKYIKYHYVKINPPMKRPEIVAKITGKNSCNYGKTKKDHPAYGTKHSEKRKRKMSKRMMKNQYGKGTKRTKEFCKAQSKRITEKMNNGQAAYMCSLNQNPSKPQVKLFKLIKSIYPQAILNYPSLNKSIDIAIPDKNIAIEYDGSYWHKGRKIEDTKRQKKLESIGWKFLRYIDYIPEIEELKKDLKEIK